MACGDRPSPRQLPLLPYRNPLSSRVGDEFFRALPREPGVYLMYGLAGAVLYVGKAKDLRARLASYRRAQPHQVSRKVLRLIHVVDEIRYETCSSEEAALLRENELLRQHRPAFNVVNTSPESYCFIGLRMTESRSGHSIELKITTRPDPGCEGWERECFHGAFKGRRSLREAYQALLRLLWASQSRAERFEFPGCLLGRRTPASYRIRLHPELPVAGARELAALLHRYLRGTSSALLPNLTSGLLDNPNIPPFYYRSIQGDLERLQGFYAQGPARNRRIRLALGLSDPLIAQDRIDDLLVMYKAKRNLKF